METPNLAVEVVRDQTISFWVHNFQINWKTDKIMEQMVAQ